jgi:hypothetical protein
VVRTATGSTTVLVPATNIQSLPCSRVDAHAESRARVGDPLFVGAGGAIGERAARPPTEAIGETDVTRARDAAGAVGAAGAGLVGEIGGDGAVGVVALLGNGEDGGGGEEDDEIDEPVHRVDERGTE